MVTINEYGQQLQQRRQAVTDEVARIRATPQSFSQQQLRGTTRLQRLKSQPVFEQAKQELGFKSSFEEIDEIFFIKNAVLDVDFVADRFSRQLCSRIVETYMNWNNYLHSLVMPNPQSMINMHESKMFSEAEMRKKIMDLITKAMALVSTNTKIGLTRDKKDEAGFIDEAVRFWNEDFKPEIVKIIEKVNSDWNADAVKND